MPWESVSNQFSPLSQSGSVDYWQQAIFFRKSQIAYMLFQQQQQTELLGSARNAPALHQHRAVGWTWTLITHHLCANHIFLSFFRPPTHESVLVSIATGLVPPSFALVSSPPLLHKNPAYSAQRVKWLHFCQTSPPLRMLVSVTLVIFLSKLQQQGLMRRRNVPVII